MDEKKRQTHRERQLSAQELSKRR